MKIGFMQFAPALAAEQETIRRMDALMDRCEGVELLVLPELCNSGYNFESPGMARDASRAVQHSEFIRHLASACRKFGFHVVSGFNERDGDALYNSAVLIGPEGCVGKYRKLHLFMKEKDCFQPGNLGLPVFDIGLCKLGMLVCFDWMFPEAWRVLALKGAEIICHPSNLVLPGLAQKAIPVHSLTNHVFVVTCNRIGSEGDLRFTGLSTIAGPKGEVLAQASEGEEEVRWLEIDLHQARDKRITPRNDIFEDRRPADYALLTE